MGRTVYKYLKFKIQKTSFWENHMSLSLIQSERAMSMITSLSAESKRI